MRLLQRLERKLGRFAIKGLMGYIVGAKALVFLFMMMHGPHVVRGALAFHPELVLEYGEYWRLFTFIFIPPMPVFILLIVFVLFFYYMIGTRLEHEWGSFRFNLYYFIGVVSIIVASLLTGEAGVPHYLNLSLFLAFATLYPEYQVRLMLMLPIKVKYLAWIAVAFIAFTVLFGALSAKIMAVVSLINYFMFFSGYISRNLKMKKRAYTGRARFQSRIPERRVVHRCAVCGITEQDDPEMEFRYCSKCEGTYEYCMDHLKNHEHK